MRLTVFSPVSRSHGQQDKSHEKSIPPSIMGVVSRSFDLAQAPTYRTSYMGANKRTTKECEASNKAIQPRGPTRRRVGVRDFEIQWISRFRFRFQDFSLDFRISCWISSGFRQDFSLNFRISRWISGFQVGFLDFKLDFWISR